MMVTNFAFKIDNFHFMDRRDLFSANSTFLNSSVLAVCEFVLPSSALPDTHIMQNVSVDINVFTTVLTHTLS